MTENSASTVRLVRCPKCENLLPELPDFSVYQCGGCGAVLKGTGKAKAPTSDGLLETSHGESGVGGLEKGGASFESCSPRESENFDIKGVGVVQEKAAILNSSSSSRAENREVSVDSDRNIRGRSDQNILGVNYNTYKMQVSKFPGANWDADTNVSDIGGLGVSHETLDTRLPFGPPRARSVAEHWTLRRNGSEPLHGPGRNVLGEGSSSYRAGSFNRYDKQIRGCEGLDGLSRVKDLENDRAELLRKLDELKDQLSRSFDATEKPKERLDQRGEHCAFESEGSNLYDVTMQSREPRYFDHYHGSVPYVKNHSFAIQDFYPAVRNVPNEYLEYGDTYHPQVIRQPHRKPPHQFFPPSYHNHFQDPHIEYYSDPLMPSTHETNFHQPLCSCLRCDGRNLQVPPKVLPQGIRSREHAYPNFGHCRNPMTYCPPAHNPRVSQDIPHTRGASDLPIHNGGFGQGHPRRVILARGSGQVCHPISGGAPLVSCCNCFELLKIPRKLLLMGKSQRKIKCGACSAVILFKVENKNLIVSVLLPTKQVQSKVGDGSGGTSIKSLVSNNSGYDFHLTDTEPNLFSNEHHSSEAEKRQELSFISSSISDDEESPDTVIVRRDNSEFCELPSDSNSSLPCPGSPLHETLDNRHGKGNESKRNDQEKGMGMVDRLIARQSSLQEASAATEMDVPLNEYPNNGIDSIEMSKEEDRVRNKGSESFFAGFIKRSLQEFSRLSRSTENGRSNVFVNGQPIPDRATKKAEKLAGPIQPGEYWYDFQAGFWGVMNQPCLGVIPPFIEEFNYPMPENCAAGNTGVFVNGRELHQRDLDLLAGRGLPSMRDKSYIVEISGRVLDEDTGEELDSLGKLAPTVERLKRGFGMKVPTAIAK